MMSKRIRYIHAVRTLSHCEKAAETKQKAAITNAKKSARKEKGKSIERYIRNDL